MKAIILVLAIAAIAAIAAGCSKSDGGGGGNNDGPYGPNKPDGGNKITAELNGTWIGDCTQTQQGPTREMLVIDGAGAQYQDLVFPGQNCTGQAQIVTGPRFSLARNGDRIQARNQTPQEGMVLNGEFQILELTDTDLKTKLTGGTYVQDGQETKIPDETVKSLSVSHYQRAKPNGMIRHGWMAMLHPLVVPSAHASPLRTRDAAALEGTWVSNCYPGDQPTREMLVFDDATVDVLTVAFDDQACTQNGKVIGEAPFTYQRKGNHLFGKAYELVEGQLAEGEFEIQTLTETNLRLKLVAASVVSNGQVVPLTDEQVAQVPAVDYQRAK